MPQQCACIPQLATGWRPAFTAELVRRPHSHPNVDCVSGRLSYRYNSVHVADLNFSGSSDGP